MPKVSVIIPVYGVENFIERCARCLFLQTLDDMEYIFVDDSTRDNSIRILNKVLEEYPNRQNQVRIIHHDRNMGLAAARKTGMKNATGEYLISCDSDDWVELNAYEEMYRMAIDNKADMCICDSKHHLKDGILDFHYPDFVKPENWLLNCRDVKIWTLWDRMIRTEIIQDNELYGEEGADMWEDLCVTLRATYCANKIVQTHKILYHYNRLNDDSVSSRKITGGKIMQQKRNLDIVLDFFQSKNYAFAGNHLKLEVKQSFFNTMGEVDWKKWLNTYPSMYKLIFKDKKMPWKYRYLYSLAHLGWTLPFKIYYKYNKRKNQNSN